MKTDSNGVEEASTVKLPPRRLATTWGRCAWMDLLQKPASDSLNIRRRYNWGRPTRNYLDSLKLRLPQPRGIQWSKRVRAGLDLQRGKQIANLSYHLAFFILLAQYINIWITIPSNNCHINTNITKIDRSPLMLCHNIYIYIYNWNSTVTSAVCVHSQRLGVNA